MISSEKILKRFESSETEYIYGRVSYRNMKPTRIEKGKLEISKCGDAFLYVFGCPGPDMDIFKFSDYGKRWAFTKSELIL